MASTNKPAPASTTDSEQPDSAEAATGTPAASTAVTSASDSAGGATVSDDDSAQAAPAADPDPLELYRARRQRAIAIREELKYNGRLTAKMLVQLEPLLEWPTPEEFKIDPGGSGTGRRPRTRTVSLHYQVRVMDDTFSRGHWRYLTHYEDGGSTARVWVVIGNRLAGVDLDETTGRLIAGEHAEILLARDGWGGISGADSKGDLLKSSQTSAARRLLGQLGPGRDVLDATTPQDGGASDPATPAAVVRLPRYRPELTAVAGAGDRKASELQVKMLCRIARTRGLPPSQVANLLREAAGAAPECYASEADAQQFLDVKLSERVIVFPFDLVTTLKHLLEQANPQGPVVPDPSPDRAQPGDRGAGEDVVAFDPFSAEAA
jgi:hypothetical protein